MSTEATADTEKTQNKKAENPVAKEQQGTTANVSKDIKTPESKTSNQAHVEKGNKDTSSKTSKTTHPHKTSKPAKEKKSGNFTASLALLLALGALGGGYWLWQQLNTALDYNQQLASELKSTMDSTRQTLEGNTRALTDTLNVEMQSITQRQQGVETQLGNLLTSIGNTARDWKVSEAQYLLQIANHKLQLQQDVGTAITALKLADARIRSTGEPALLPVREQIGKEITALENFSLPDVTGASIKLASIIENIDKLPLQVRIQSVGQTTANPDEKVDDSNKLENLPSAMWDSLKGLITIHYNDRPMEPLLTPTQATNLIDNTKIKLEQARLAVIQKNKTLYQDSLQRTIEWLEKFFRTSDEQVKTVISQLSELKQLEITPALPDISTSLRQLKKIAKQIDLKIDNGKQGEKS